ncbi:YopX family protein [Lysinibacillus xylanilyticus]|uniref:YopX family protein n=1 Tax=Lysinibacillus xylanilyticus TaxID=582475 RepID=UPI0036DDDAA0
MREVKFRFWDKEFKRFSEVPQKYAIQDINHYTDYELMQYTGLKDCNGEEIFEGDLIKDFINEKTYQVFWDNYGMFIFTELNSTTGGLDYYQLEDEASMACLMVIGNIYENPELLEEIQNESK